VPAQLTRIFSDVHFGDRASRVARLAQLRPLLEGVDTLVINGDAMDTRPGPWPAHTSACRAELLEFFRTNVPAATFVTGNHDPDFSPHHLLEFGRGAIVVTHGDIVFDSMVPWGQDATTIARQISAAMAALPAGERHKLEHRFAIWRRVALAVPQRHQSEPNRLKYALYFARDTVWPPLRIFRILHAWRTYSPRAAEFVHTHRPEAKFMVVGHTHRPGIWRHPRGTVVINTGSFTPPLGGCAVDITDDGLTVRQINSIADEFRIGETIAQFQL
jgi:predicted phosphodiesterase